MKINIFSTLFSLCFTCTVIAQSTNVAPDEAGKYLGKVEEVGGPVYGEEYREGNITGSATELIYLSGSHYAKADFVIILEIKSLKGDTAKINAFKRESERNRRQLQKAIDANNKSAFYRELGAKGKIFLFEGKPAIKIKDGELLILEPVS